MRRSYTSSQMGFPRFTGAVRNLVIASALIYVALLLLRAYDPQRALDLLRYTGLSAGSILQGRIWQFLTYGFVDWDPLSFLFSMLAVYFLGSAVEDRIGPRAFYEMYISSLVGAGAAGVLLSLAFPIGRAGGVIGAGAAANAILMVFFLLYRDSPIMLFPIPIPIPVKYIVIFTAAIESAYLLLSRFSSLFYLVLLLGLGMGYVWYRMLWRRSILGALEEQWALARNGYYRWKRRRAARKFQVYMRKHQHDPKQYFDEYGNFKPPDDKEKGNRGPGGWVN